MKILSTHTSKKGFTLVETLVAITILLLVIIGPLTVAQKGIQNAYYANEQVTAVFLAQEAIEAVRELRDNNALDAFDSPGSVDTWDWYTDPGSAVLESECKSGDGCALAPNPSGTRFKKCNGATNNCKLKINGGVYLHTGVGPDSPFTRKVYIEEEASGEVSVKVDVEWVSQIFGGASTRHVLLQTYIYDHYQRYEEN